MICSHCQYQIFPWQRYHRTKKGPHHHNCELHRQMENGKDDSAVKTAHRMNVISKERNEQAIIIETLTAERDESLKQGLALTLLVDELREEVKEGYSCFKEMSDLACKNFQTIEELREALALAQNALAQAH